MDAVIADLEGSSRTSVQSWLPTRTEAASMGVSCIGRTSPAPGIFYDPTNTNEIIAVSPTKPPTVSPTEPPTEPPTISPTKPPTYNDDDLRSNSSTAFENDSTESSSFETDAIRSEMSAGHSLLSGCGIGIGIFVLGMLLQEVIQTV